MIAASGGTLVAFLFLLSCLTEDQEKNASKSAISSAEVGARVRLIARLGRKGRLNEANKEAVLLMQRVPTFSAREWVTDTYLGVRREPEREENIRLLVSLGLPEHRKERASQ